MQTIGERLEEARKKKGISIREAAESTKIRGDYLQKFESNHFDIGLTEIYTRGFLRTYATFLKLPAERILSDYTALGRSESRPRAHNREIYGRLEVSTPTPEEPESESPATDENASSTPPVRPAPPRPRTGSSLPTGPDPAMVFKYAKWFGIGIAVVVVGFIVKSLFSGSDKPAESAKSPTVAAPAARNPTLGLIATSPVQVTVRKKNADESEGELVFSGMLATGENKSVPRTGALFIEASAAENLQIEINGKRHSLGQLLGTGYQRGQLPGP